MGDYFLGALTPVGFINYFNEIVDFKKGNRRYILKGGSGVGKSTFIKKAAVCFEEMGHSVDRFYCANSPESLDAMRVNDLGLAIIDGTAPHVVDTYSYGAFDEIINLGMSIENIDRDIFDETKNLQNAKNGLNKSVQNYLNSAYWFYSDINDNFETALNKVKYYKNLNTVKNMFKPKSGLGKLERVFISAFTLNNYKSFLKTVKYKKSLCVKNGFLSINSKFLKEVLDYLISAGYDCITFSNNFQPNLPIGIYIKNLEFLIYSTSFLDRTVLKDSEVLNVDNMFNKNLTDNSAVLYDFSFIENILTHCYKKLLQVNSYHNDLEQLFVPFVNFENNDKELEKLLRKEGTWY